VLHIEIPAQLEGGNASLSKVYVLNDGSAIANFQLADGGISTFRLGSMAATGASECPAPIVGAPHHRIAQHCCAQRVLAEFLRLLLGAIRNFRAFCALQKEAGSANR